MLPITYKLSQYNHSAGNDVQYIVIHDTGNYSDSDEGNAHYFGEANRGASAHYFVDPDSITQVVRESEASWHCGDGHNRNGINNHNSIGIEMCKYNGTIASETINHTLDLTRALMDKYNLPASKVVRHFDASGKNCPESMSDNNWALWKEFKRRLTGETSTSSVASTEPKAAQVVGVSSFLNVRDGASTNSNVIGKVFAHEIVHIKWTEPGWHYIVYNTARGTKEGYVYAKYITEL